METESSLLPTIDVVDENQIQHARHVHPLTLCEIDDTYCSVCLESCLGRRTYGCNHCRLFLHDSCTKIEIPEEIDHYFHPHPLKLAINESKHSECEACYESLLGLMFECRDCKFYMDVKCALLPTKLKQDGSTIDHIQHLKHGHPLMLCDDEKKIDHFFCSFCSGELITCPCFSYEYDTSLLLEGSQSIYVCLSCKLSCHESCARLPMKIDSPLHPCHSLELSLPEYDDSFCRGCYRPGVNRIRYKCRSSCTCTFVLGVECAFLNPPILKFEAHDHLLTLFPSVGVHLRCDICECSCDGSKIFRCVECDYNLHLHCGPLPRSIKDKCHIHPLKLTYAFVEDGYEDDNVYCDACEQPRDPYQCVYFCKDCNFIAELKCVGDEVLPYLNGQRGNVKLRTANKTRIQVGAKIISNVITDNDEKDYIETDSENETEDTSIDYLEVKLHENSLSGIYTDDECKQLIEIFKKAHVRLHPSTPILRESNEELCAHIKRYEQAELLSKCETSLFCHSSDVEYSDIGENIIAEPYSDEFKQLMRNLDSYYEDEILLEMFFRIKDDAARSRDHEIVQDAASVLKGLLHKYGDFTAKSKLSERLKVIFLAIFCQVIRSMCLTNVKEVYKDLLQKWWKSLKLVQHAGFEIEFAIDRLYNVVQASFGMKAITSHCNMKSQADNLSKRIEEKEAKLEAMKRELEELKPRVEKDKYVIEYQSSPVLKECLKHVSELKWQKAWDGSPIMFR